MVKHIHSERPPSGQPGGPGESPTGLVSLAELRVMRESIMQLVGETGGKDVPAWVRDFARVVQTLATTYERANELRRGTIDQCAGIAEECGSGEAAARIRGLA